MIRIINILALMTLLISCTNKSPTHFYKNASAKYQLKNYAGAVIDLNRAITLDPLQSKSYYLRALCLVELDRLNEAASDFDQTIKLDPDFKDAYLNRAFYILDKSGDYQNSIKDYNKFIELNPQGNNAFALNNRGFAKLKLNMIKEAKEDIIKSLAVNQTNPFAYKNLALVYISLDSIPAACNQLHRALEFGYTEKYDDEVLRLIEQHCPDQ